MVECLVHFLCFHACLVTVRKSGLSLWNLKTAAVVNCRFRESEWQRKHEFVKEKRNGCSALSHSAVLAVFLLYPLTSAAPHLCIPTFLNLYSVAQTDSSDNSDLEDDIILSLNEWGAHSIWDRETGQHVKTPASQTFELQNRRREKKRVSADEVGDNLEHCQFETVGICTLWVKQDEEIDLTGG